MPPEVTEIREATASAPPETDPFYEALSSDRDAIRWLVRHADELKDGDMDGTFSNVAMLQKSMVLLDENLVLDKNRDRHVASILFSQYCDMNHIDTSGLSDDFVRSAIVVVEKYVLGQEADPRYSWNASMVRQSEEAKDVNSTRILETLVGRGGVWRTMIVPDRPTKTGGALELQQLAAQGSLIFAQNAFEHATEQIPYHPDPPNPSGRQGIQDDAQSFLAKAKDGALWDQKHLRTIKTSHAKQAAPIDVLTRTMDGKTHYREFGSFSAMPVRIFRENPDAKTLEYADVPLDKLETLPPDVLNQLLGTYGDRIFGGEYSWNTVPTKPKLKRKFLKQDAPLMSISVGQTATPDSALFEHARDGQSIVHMHYNLDKSRVELYWSHASVDGVPGKAMTLALARAVDAIRTPPPRDLEIEWFPPVQFNEVPSPFRLWMLKRTIQHDLQRTPQKLDYLENKTLNELTYSLGISDLTVHTELFPQQVVRLERASEAINTQWYRKAEAKIRTILTRDPLSKRAEKALLNRLAAVRMNENKFIDLMTRQFFGNMAVCMLPRDTRGRLQLGLMPNMSDAIVNAMYTYAFRKAKNPQVKVFGSPGEREYVSPEDVRASLGDAFQLMTTEYGLDWLMDFTILTVLQESTQKFRGIAENTAAFARRMLMEANDEVFFERSLIRIQNSHLGSSQATEMVTQPQGAPVEQQVAVMAGFTSAETWHREITFAGGIATHTFKRKDGTAMSVDMRDKATPEFIDSLRIYDPTVMNPAIDAVARQLAGGDTARERHFREIAREALDACVVARRDLYRTASTTGIASTLVITEALMRNRQLFEGIKILCIAGALEMEQRFLDMSLAAADEIVDMLESGTRA